MKANLSNKNLTRILKAGGIGIIPTDTLYGLVGSALSRRATERIYKLRKRDLKKPMIILISAIGDLDFFDIKLTPYLRDFLKKIWPGPVSVILPVLSKKFVYLHRGTETLAFRLPKNLWLRSLLKKTGPLVAPSANFEGSKPAYTISKAKRYFGSAAAFYFDKGFRRARPSIIVEIKRR